VGVRNTAHDMDGQYLNKYPHCGYGDIKPQASQNWREIIGPELGAVCLARCKLLCDTIGYDGIVRTGYDAVTMQLDSSSRPHTHKSPMAGSLDAVPPRVQT